MKHDDSLMTTDLITHDVDAIGRCHRQDRGPPAVGAAIGATGFLKLQAGLQPCAFGLLRASFCAQSQTQPPCRPWRRLTSRCLQHRKSMPMYRTRLASAGRIGRHPWRRSGRRRGPTTAQNHGLQRRHDDEQHDGSNQHATHHDGRERALHLATDSRRDRRG
jgi:hypothetical protein